MRWEGIGIRQQQLQQQQAAATKAPLITGHIHSLDWRLVAVWVQNLADLRSWQGWIEEKVVR